MSDDTDPELMYHRQVAAEPQIAQAAYEARRLEGLVVPISVFVGQSGGSVTVNHLRPAMVQKQDTVAARVAKFRKINRGWTKKKERNR